MERPEGVVALLRGARRGDRRGLGPGVHLEREVHVDQLHVRVLREHLVDGARGALAERALEVRELDDGDGRVGVAARRQPGGGGPEALGERERLGALGRLPLGARAGERRRRPAHVERVRGEKVERLGVLGDEERLHAAVRDRQHAAVPSVDAARGQAVDADALAGERRHLVLDVGDDLGDAVGVGDLPVRGAAAEGEGEEQGGAEKARHGVGGGWAATDAARCGGRTGARRELCPNGAPRAAVPAAWDAGLRPVSSPPGGPRAGARRAPRPAARHR